MPKLHAISQKLAFMTKPGSWSPIGDFTEQELTELRFAAASELRQSDLGKQLFTRGGADVFDRVLEEFAIRSQPPSVIPFVETLHQAARDVLVTLPIESYEAHMSVTDPREEQRQANAFAEQAAKSEERTKHLRKFAHMVNAALAYEGPKVLKPRDGFIRLKFEENGKLYEYEYKYGDGKGKRDHNGNLFTSEEYNQFMRDFEEAIERGLIKR
jgi:hypothetical protein